MVASVRVCQQLGDCYLYGKQDRQKKQTKDTQKRQTKQCSASSSAGMAALAVASAHEMWQQQEVGALMDARNTGFLFLSHLVHATWVSIHFTELEILNCMKSKQSASLHGSNTPSEDNLKGASTAQHAMLSFTKGSNVNHREYTVNSRISPQN